MTRAKVRTVGVGCLFLYVGIAGLAARLRVLSIGLGPEAQMEILVNVVALVVGVFLLLGHNWARWTGMAWLMLHVAIGFLHGAAEGFFHLGLTLAIGYLLFEVEVRAYLRSDKP